MKKPHIFLLLTGYTVTCLCTTNGSICNVSDVINFESFSLHVLTM